MRNGVEDKQCTVVLEVPSSSSVTVRSSMGVPSALSTGFSCEREREGHIEMVVLRISTRGVDDK